MPRDSTPTHSISRRSSGVSSSITDSYNIYYKETYGDNHRTILPAEEGILAEFFAAYAIYIKEKDFLPPFHYAALGAGNNRIWAPLEKELENGIFSSFFL